MTGNVTALIIEMHQQSNRFRKGYEFTFGKVCSTKTPAAVRFKENTTAIAQKKCIRFLPNLSASLMHFFWVFCVYAPYHFGRDVAPGGFGVMGALENVNKGIISPLPDGQKTRSCRWSLNRYRNTSSLYPGTALTSAPPCPRRTAPGCRSGDP